LRKINGLKNGENCRNWTNENGNLNGGGAIPRGCAAIRVAALARTYIVGGDQLHENEQRARDEPRLGHFDFGFAPKLRVAIVTQFVGVIDFNWPPALDSPQRCNSVGSVALYASIRWVKSAGDDCFGHCVRLNVAGFEFARHVSDCSVIFSVVM
jgi:hypothetical protein